MDPLVPRAWTPLEPGDPAQVGPYTLLGRLGAGGMGQVFLARSPAGRRVAVKTIRPEHAATPEFRARFTHEAAAAARVSGAFTAAVVASDPHAPVPWIATDYVRAPSLQTLVETCGPLPPGAVMWLAAGTAEALQSIHTVGIIHRDLKPSNILVDEQGPRVIDFGLVYAVGSVIATGAPGRATTTGGTTAIGTPGYMAPEQAHVGWHALSTASDVYALGLTMLYAATGCSPGQPVPQLPTLPATLRDLIARCVEQDPRRRPSTSGIIAELGSSVDLMAYEGAEGWLSPAAWEFLQAFRSAATPGTTSPTGLLKAAPPQPRDGDPDRTMPAVPVVAPPPGRVNPPEPRQARYAALDSAVHTLTPQERPYAAAHDQAAQLASRNQHREAAKAFHQLYQEVSGRFGAHHTLAVFAQLGNIHALGRLGWHAMARDQAQQAVHHLTQALGAAHPHTFLMRGEHALWTGHGGNPGHAAELLQSLVTEYSATVGPTAPATLAVRTELALWTGLAGDPGAASYQLHAVVADCRATLSEIAAITLDAKSSHAHWTGAAGDPRRAAQLYEFILAEAQTAYGPDAGFTRDMIRRRDYWRSR
ncbi:hypothetical protein GCM10023205_70480 [Yinghuangia aomiensis]|uniref:Protein kinase domain-containing protein n=1 Tax=Yinghuangia aomiensis TaxID=676205 RepID=A0ABP9I6W9_9ACTN